MADDTHLFIDGKCLRDKHSKALLRVFPKAPEISLFQLKAQANAKRVFFYDCLHEIKDEAQETLIFGQSSKR